MKTYYFNYDKNDSIRRLKDRWKHKLSEIVNDFKLEYPLKLKVSRQLCDLIEFIKSDDPNNFTYNYIDDNYDHIIYIYDDDECVAELIIANYTLIDHNHEYTDILPDYNVVDKNGKIHDKDLIDDKLIEQVMKNKKEKVLNLIYHLSKGNINYKYASEQVDLIFNVNKKPVCMKNCGDTKPYNGICLNCGSGIK